MRERTKEFEKLLDTVTMRRKIEIAELVVSYIYISNLKMLYCIITFNSNVF
jgi:hypothetical protein